MHLHALVGSIAANVVEYTAVILFLVAKQAYGSLWSPQNLNLLDIKSLHFSAHVDLHELFRSIAANSVKN